MRFENIEEIAKLVRERKVVSVPMKELRDAIKYDRLGTVVVSKLKTALRDAGIAHYPVKLPERQDRTVRLFLKHSKLAEMVALATSNSFTEENDEKLKLLVSQLDPDGLHEKVASARAEIRTVVEILVNLLPDD